MKGKQKSHVINKDKGPPKLRRKEGKLLKAGKMLTSSAQEEKIMVNKLSKALQVTEKHSKLPLLLYFT